MQRWVLVWVLSGGCAGAGVAEVPAPAESPSSENEIERAKRWEAEAHEILNDAPATGLDFSAQLLWYWETASTQDEAVALLERALEVYESHELPGTDRVDILLTLGSVYGGREQYPESEGALRSAKTLLEDSMGADARQIICFNLLGTTYRRWGRLDAAVATLEEAVALIEVVPSTSENPLRNLLYSQTFENLGRVHQEAGRFVEAQESYEHALDLAMKVDPTERGAQVTALNDRLEALEGLIAPAQ